MVNIQNDPEFAGVTSIGRRVYAFLVSRHIPGALAMLRSPGTAAEILSQALVIALRRRFVLDRQFDPDAYIRDALRGDEAPSAERVRVGMKLIQHALAEPTDADLLRTKSDVAILLLLHVIKDLAMSSQDITRLVAASEQRVARLLNKAEFQQGFWNGLKWRRFKREIAERAMRQPGSTGPVPQTHMGRILEALAAYDYASARSVPDSDHGGVGSAVVHAAFLLAVRQRFPAGQLQEEIVRVGTDISGRAKSFSAAPEEIGALILSALDSTTPEPDLGYEALLQAKTATFMSIVDSLGLFKVEIAAMLVRAEQAADIEYQAEDG